MATPAPTYQRVSAGIYRNTKTGQTIRSATDPNKGPDPLAQKTAAPKSATTKTTTPPATPQLKEQSAASNKDVQIAGQSTEMSNPDYTGDLGGQKVTVDANGNPTIQYQASAPEQALLQNQQNLGNQAYSTASQALGNSTLGQGFNPNIPQPTLTGSDQDFTNISNQIFTHLTRGLDDQQTRETNQLRQQLVQSGNPVGSPAYDDQMKQLATRYDNQRTDAQAQAVQQTGSTLAQQSGVEQAAASGAMSRATQGNQQQLNDLQGLYGLSPGYQMQQGIPQFTPTSLQQGVYQSGELTNAAASAAAQQSQAGASYANAAANAAGAGAAYANANAANTTANSNAAFNTWAENQASAANKSPYAGA